MAFEFTYSIFIIELNLNYKIYQNSVKLRLCTKIRKTKRPQKRTINLKQIKHRKISLKIPIPNPMWIPKPYFRATTATTHPIREIKTTATKTWARSWEKLT